jgi:Cu(I)/Ag(I) efflux system membrane fusion protein
MTTSANSSGTWRASIALAALSIAGFGATARATAADTADQSEGARSAIRLDREQRQAIGLTYGLVERRSIEKTIRTVGRFDYDERKLAAVTLKISGYVKDLFVDYTGKAVRKGEPLFTIYSPELVSAEQEYLLAIRNQRELGASRVPGAAESAASLLRASRQRLLLWDVGEHELRALEEAGEPRLHETIHSPASGIVIEKMIVAGQSVQAGATLYKIADLSTIWVYADVYEYELPFVKVGQKAEIRLSYAPGRSFAARVAYIYPTLDPKTRTVKVRFELPNTPDDLLRPEMYGTVELRVPLGERLVVPKTAILDSGRRQLAFVDSGDGRLTPREVALGDRVDDYVEVREGLQPGERVVTSATFLVDSESQLQGAESMMGMMGAIGMGDQKMAGAKPMSMGGGDEPPMKETPPSSGEPTSAVEERRIGDLVVSVYPAAGTARVGAATIRVRVRDADGSAVGQAKVRFEYSMDMAGMGIQSAEAREIGDGVYEATAKLTMAGPWSLVVQIDRPGNPIARGKFTLRVVK